MYKKTKFSLKFLKTGFVASDNWQQAPGFDPFTSHL